jgi:hypothetical protein
VNARKLIVSALLAAVAIAAAAAEPTRCPEGRVTVTAADSADIEDGCDGAAAAIAFFAAQGVEPRGSIEISFVDVMPPVVGDSPSVGCYVRSEGRIYVLAFERCRTLRMGHDIPVDRAVHRGLVAHEVAHRIVADHVAPRRLGTVAHEYIAYVAMYASLPAPERERLLSNTPGDGFKAESEISPTIYVLDPVLFGAQSYRHFIARQDGPTFLAEVMAGKALAGEE